MGLHRKLISFFALCICFVTGSLGQQSVSPAIERQFNKIEKDILSSAQAMPEDKFDFTPESLNIKNSDFKGVRTFAGQIKHLATDNILIWSAINGDSIRADIEDVNGPKKYQI